jgi:hypothetical protein
MRAFPSKRDRDGSVVVVVLVCLMALAMIGAASLRVALDERRVIRAEEGRLQAEWLMRSGLERAVFRLAEEDAYEGETWEIPADAAAGRATAVVRIVVAEDDTGRNRRRVSVRADLSSGSSQRVRRSGSWVVERGPEPSGDTP